MNIQLLTESFVHIMDWALYLSKLFLWNQVTSWCFSRDCHIITKQQQNTNRI